ncbi:MOSC domain-containing protein [Thalassotalea euphylliae]|uniref:MOSC domain-containing protein n=1 Tax=Thalassotalea euphylliae TaxID=1655234 RepID=A0A3E0TMP8_9GAMM|nr:hybrid-cluster NAD(P)-dependent oxidoreductase [Thalassotalea euphylliae]REL25422.1 MOSC domain-containing protein [Thalassotalea euphylliae]
MAHLQEISVYPIKSTAGIQLSSSWVDPIGLPYDRRFVVCDQHGQFITARTHAKLCLIQANLTPDGLMLTAPDMPLLAVRYQQLIDEYQHVAVWGDTILGQRCHTSVDLWFSQFLGQSCHLLFFGEQSNRQVKNTTNPVAFADGYPLLLISQASLEHLNSRLKQPVSMRQFRPNMVVQDCEPFAEDTWRHIRIGEVEFELTKPCTRCVFTTVDPDTSEKHNQLEPLATLKTFRQLAKGDVLFGQNLIPLNQGQIRLGDPVTVLDRQFAPEFVNVKAVGRANTTKKQTTSQQAADIPRLVPSAEQASLICQHIYDETHDVKTFAFKAKNGSLPENFKHYQAGQHLPFKLTIEGKTVNAIYTLSSSPTRSETLTITVKRVPNGRVSNFLHDHFTVGSEIVAKAPNGKFHLGNISQQRILLLSAGSGITPMLSMLKALTDQCDNREVVFFHSARSEKDLIAFEEARALAKQHGHCKLHFTLTQSASPQWQDFQGHLNAKMLSVIPEISSVDAMVCGPQGFRDNAKALLLAAGLPESQFHFESFGKRLNDKSTESASVPMPSPVSIRFDSWDKAVVGNTKESILEQGEAAGLIMSYSCRGGMCGSCKVKLESGEVRELASDGLMPSDKAQGYILACSCVPKSDIVISKVPPRK